MIRSIGSHSERTNSSTHLSCPAHSGSVEKSQATDRPFDTQLLRPTALWRTTPASVSSASALSSNPSPASTAAVLSPGSAGDRGGAGTVRENRGAGAGCGTPSTSMNVCRATLCGWLGPPVIVNPGAAHDPG